jgi:hypothetical protein
MESKKASSGETCNFPDNQQFFRQLSKAETLQCEPMALLQEKGISLAVGDSGSQYNQEPIYI